MSEKPFFHSSFNNWPIDCLPENNEPPIIKDLRNGLNINDNPNIGDKEREEILNYIEKLKERIKH